MAYRADTTRDEVLYNSSFSDAWRGLFRTVGGFGNVSGPGLFMLRCFFAGASASVYWCLAGSSIAAITYGTAALPSIIFAIGGFAVGSISYYMDCQRKALLSLERFHLYRPEQLTSAYFSSWTMRGMLMSAWLTATPALDRIMENEEEVVIQQIASESKEES